MHREPDDSETIRMHRETYIETLAIARNKPGPNNTGPTHVHEHTLRLRLVLSEAVQLDLSDLLAAFSSYGHVAHH